MSCFGSDLLPEITVKSKVMVQPRFHDGSNRSYFESPLAAVLARHKVADNFYHVP